MTGTRWFSHACSLAAHLLVLSAFTFTPRPAPRAVSRSAATTKVMHVVDLRAREPEASAPAPAREESAGVPGDPDLQIGAFTFDIDRIARRRTLLFPFITGDPAFTGLERSLSTTGERGW